MTIEQVKQLHSGDQVFWNDPDNGLCSRHFCISSVCIRPPVLDRDDDIITIVDKDGSALECFASELS